MYESLRGKKLLVIGSEETDNYLVRTAQSMGVYVIAVDGKKTSDKTVAKKTADESWDIDYQNVDTIVKKCKESRVDGVIAGYSENRVLAACRIANVLGLPFYATEEQINKTRNKRVFKEICSQNNVPVPREYCITGFPTKEEITAVPLPVIIKPADSAGRKGITICYTSDEIEPAIKRALKESYSQTIVMEEYIIGKEFAAIYTLQDGYYSLSYFNEKYLNPVLSKSGICDFSMSPSRYLGGFLTTCDKPIRQMMKSIGITNGVAFFQGIVNESGYWIFEMGYRLNGANDCEQIERINHINYAKMIIAHSLTGIMEGIIKNDNPDFSAYSGVLTLYAKGGKINQINYSGDPTILKAEMYHSPGSIIQSDSSTQQRVFRFKILTSTINQMQQLIQYAQNHVQVLDSDNRDMLLSTFDPQRIET